MNKDKLLLTFSCVQNEYDELSLSENKWFSSAKPIGYTNIDSFVDRRKAPKHRKHIQELLERYGCEDITGFLKITHALSLNDTFWVKEENSPLVWSDVSLYRNDFNEIISKAAFDGSFSDSSISSTSPEFGTDGNYAKCWVRENGAIFLYKCGSATYELEPVSEFLATQLAERICSNYVGYDLDYYHNHLVCKCELFTSESIGLAKVKDLGIKEKSIPVLLGFFESIGADDDFRRMCVLDALIMNIDRHLGNFGVLYDNDSMKILSMAPVYDNNRSLFFDLDNDQLKNVEWYVRKRKPRIGADFISTAKGLLTDEIRQDLKNLIGFQFKQHDSIKIDQERLDLLSDFVNSQIRTILL